MMEFKLVLKAHMYQILYKLMMSLLKEQNNSYQTQKF